ncbi:MAG: oxidative damage protection protein [Wenzhouxiangella sp.]
MSRIIHCAYLNEDAEGLERPPLPGELGQRIYERISKPAWQRWLAHQTMLINEKRLSPIDPAHRKYLVEQAEAFLFGGEVDEAEGYVPPES